MIVHDCTSEDLPMNTFSNINGTMNVKLPKYTIAKTELPQFFSTMSSQYGGRIYIIYTTHTNMITLIWGTSDQYHY